MAGKPTFTKDEDEFIEKSREINFPWKLIAETLDRAEGTCKSRFRKLNLTNPRRYDKDDQLPERICAVHRGPFIPTSPYNFVCPACKDTEVWKNRGGLG